MNVAVSPDQSGRGVGKVLIETAISSARDAGHTIIELTTHKDMPQHMVLYQYLVWKVFRQGSDKIFMTRLLDTGPTGSRHR